MTKATKVFLIIGMFIICGFIMSVIGAAAGNPNAGKPFGAVIAIGVLAASRAIWKYQPEKEETTKDIDKLDKS